MRRPELKARLEVPEDRGREIQFDDLTKLCDRLKECLRATESSITEDVPRARYKLTELELGSVDIALAPAERGQLTDVAASTIGLFNRSVAAINAGKGVDDRLTRVALQAYKKLAETFLRRKSTVSIAGIQITTRFVANIEELLGRYFMSEGSVKGRIERLNIHNKNECALYSPIHDRGIECSFDTETFPEVHAALGKNSTVLGKLKFSGRSALPEHIHITSVQIHPDDDELPTLGSLRGFLGASALGGMSTTEFLSSMRNGDE
jgi:hypothetical protein